MNPFDMMLEGLNMVMGGRFMESLLDHLDHKRCRDIRCMACRSYGPSVARPPTKR